MVGQEGYIYTSSDSGATWNKTGTQQFWLSVASSANGTNLVAGSDNYLYTSSDSGATWTQRGAERHWQSVASSADGTRLFAVSANTTANPYIYTSTGPVP